VKTSTPHSSSEELNPDRFSGNFKPVPSSENFNPVPFQSKPQLRIVSVKISTPYRFSENFNPLPFQRNVETRTILMEQLTRTVLMFRLLDMEHTRFV